MATKTPADRQPKAKADAYTFRHQGKNYRLPLASSAAGLVEGRYLRDAAMEGEEGQLRLGFAMLEAVEATPGALDALYAMPAEAMMEHVYGWMNYKPADDEPSVGESARSSD